MIERIAALANRDAALLRWGRHMNDTFMVEVGDTQYLVTVRKGQIQSIEKEKLVMRSWRFAIRAPRECWKKHWQNPPPPGWHDLFALLRRGEVAFEGAGGGRAREGRKLHGDEGPGALPDEREPRGVPRLPASGAGRDPAYSTFAPDTLTTSDQRACSSRR